MEKKEYYSFFKRIQQNEIEGAYIYRSIADFTKNEKERQTLLAISNDECKHAKILEQYTGCKPTPRRFRMRCYTLVARLLGYTFVIKLLERSEDIGIKAYQKSIETIPELKEILEEEEIHEQMLLDILDEERLHYVGDMVLGMNDALVELTGALAGYTLAMQNTHLIVMAGLITGISATLSMAASGYLSAKEAGEKNAVKSSAYTGLAYLVTVALLIVPYLLLPAHEYLWALAITLVIAVAIIAAFNFYISVAKSRPFRRNFLIMAGISLGVAVISFGVGLVVKNVLGIDL